MKISIMGAGYVGLNIGACLAQMGNSILLVDIDQQKIKLINEKQPLIHEPGLDEVLAKTDIAATSDYYRMLDSEAIFICVGTPLDSEGSISLEDIIEAARQIAQVLKKRTDYTMIVVKSTVVPGTTEEVIIPILEESGAKVGDDFGVCMSPEFLREGKALYDAMNPARLIIGEYDARSGERLAHLHRNFDVPILHTNLRTAEMIKYASNSFLATKISFINEIGNICKQLGIDTYEVAQGMGFDERIGNKFLNAGIGFGGSCLPKDLKALIARARQLGYEPRILQQVSDLNEKQGLKVVELLKRHVSLKGSHVGLLGLAFKPETDDVRESPAIRIVSALLHEEVVIKAYDPVAVENFRKIFPQIEYVTKEEILKCDAIILITEWEEFNNLDYRGKIVIDGRRVAKAKEARIYEGVCW